MRYELKKIIINIPLCTLLLLAAAINALLFFSYCTDASKGYTMAQIQAKFKDIGAVELQQKKLEALSENAEEKSLGGTLLTGDIYLEQALNREVLERAAQSYGYDEFRDNLAAESKLKLMLGIFGEPGSFEARSLEKSAGVYEGLAAVRPAAAFFGGIELFAGRHITELLLLVFCVAVPFVLLVYENSTGIKLLTHTAKNGRLVYYFRKLAASVSIMTAGFVLLYGANILILLLLFGMPDLSAPVQSVYGYSGCPFMISAGQFVFILILLKYLWAVACLAAAVFICSLCDSGVKAAVIISAVTGAAAALGGSSILWLRNISLSRLINIEELFKGAVYLNLFGAPAGRVTVAVVFLAVVSLGLLLAGMLSFCRASVVKTVKNKFFVKRPSLHYKSIFGWEAHKSLFTRKGAVILLAFILLQSTAYKDYEVINSDYEIYYRNYSERLAGRPDAEKDKFIADEKERFRLLSAQLSEAGQSDSGTDPDVDVDEIQNRLRPAEAFEAACSQYEGLADGQSYVYKTPYRIIYGYESRRGNLMNFIKLFFVLALLVSPFFAYEKETGVAILQNTAGKTKKIALIKTAIAAALAAICTAAAFVPKYTAVFSGYGGLDLTAQANSIEFLRRLPDIFSVGGVFAATYILYTLTAASMSAVIMLLSSKIKNSAVALMASMAFAILPSAMFLFI